MYISGTGNAYAKTRTVNSVQTFIGGDREAGLAYVVMLLTLVIAISLALSFMLRVGTETEAAMSRSTGMQAEYLAESAAAHAKWLLLNDQTFPPDETIYYMHSFAGGRYGYKVRRHTDTTFASISTVGIIHAASDPTSDYIFVGGLDSGNDLNVAVWDGSSWIDSVELSDKLQAFNKQIFDVAWEDSGDDVLVIWGRDKKKELRYAQWTKGTALSSVSVSLGPTFAAKFSTMQAFPYGEADHILVVAVDESSNVYSTVWKGDDFESSSPTLVKSAISKKDRMSFDAVSIP